MQQFVAAKSGAKLVLRPKQEQLLQLLRLQVGRRGWLLPVPPPLRRQALAVGPHAVVHHVGPYEQLQALGDALLRDWWPDSGHALADAPLYFHFLDDPEQVPAHQLRADVCLPLAG